MPCEQNEHVEHNETTKNPYSWLGVPNSIGKDALIDRINARNMAIAVLVMRIHADRDVAAIRKPIEQRQRLTGDTFELRIERAIPVEKRPRLTACIYVPVCPRIPEWRLEESQIGTLTKLPNFFLY